MNAEEAKQKFNDADRLYRAGDYNSALVSLEKLRAAFPGEKNVLYALTLCLQTLGRRDDALVGVGQLRDLGDRRADQLQASLAAVADVPNTTTLRVEVVFHRN